MIEKLLMQGNIEYKRIDEDNNLVLYKINSKNHLLYIYNKGNQFLMNRDFFDYLDNNKLPYLILLHDKQRNKMYLLDLKKENNWVKSCFLTCDKDEIYLGKQVLNYPISEENLLNRLKRI